MKTRQSKSTSSVRERLLRKKRVHRAWEPFRSRKVTKIISAKPYQGGGHDDEGNGSASDGYHHIYFKLGYAKIIPETWERLYRRWDRFFENDPASDDFMVERDQPTDVDPYLGSSFDDFLEEKGT